jgi:hypothetical protein
VRKASDPAGIALGEPGCYASPRADTCRSMGVHRSPVPALLIDDLDEAAARLSSFARTLLSEDLSRLRQILLEHATWNEWRVLSYASFVDWSASLADGSLAIIADKLYPTNRLRSRTMCMEVHRYWMTDSAERQVFVEPESRCVIPNGEPVVIIDDAAWSGSTLHEICTLANSAGGKVRQVIVGAATPHAEEMLSKTGATFSRFTAVPEGWDILHARDFCPWLPYSGRKLGSTSLAKDTGFTIRLAPLFHNDGAWLQLGKHPSQGRLTDLALHGIDRLESYLGRVATIQDLHLFGPNVSLPIDSPEALGKITMRTTLRETIGGTKRGRG